MTQLRIVATTHSRQQDRLCHICVNLGEAVEDRKMSERHHRGIPGSRQSWDGVCSDVGTEVHPDTIRR